MENIVVMGGGTGTFVVLSGIKDFEDFAITAVVSSADSGGSTGVLRDEFGQLPVGDIRQCLVALSPQISNGKSHITRELFQYRFDRGNGLKGHSFGNLFLTALTEILGSELLAIQKAAEILNIKGKVLPVTTDDVTLVAKYVDGSIGFGEEMIDSVSYSKDNENLKIEELSVQPRSEILSETKDAISNSNYLILGPGDLYTSIIANLVVDGVSEVICDSDIKIIYFVNLFTKHGQTTNYKASDHVSDIEKYLKKKVDYIVINSSEIPRDVIVRYYDEEHVIPVMDDLMDDDRVVRADLVSSTLSSQSDADRVKRSVVRHDSVKVGKVIRSLIS